MKIEKLEYESTDAKSLDNDEVLRLVKECFESKGWIRTGDTFVLYPGEKSLPDAVQVFTIKRVRTYVDRDSETWKERGIPRKNPEEMKILKAQLYEAIKNKEGYNIIENDI